MSQLRWNPFDSLGLARCFLVAAPLLAGLCSAAPPSTDALDRALRAHVHPGGKLEGIPTTVVNYTALATDGDFHAFVDSLAGVEIDNLSRSETYELFMNAYNALTIKMILDHPCKHGMFGRCEGPIASILDIGYRVGKGAASTVWSMPAGTIAGRTYSLQQIEDFLRSPGRFAEDPRLHACIVCASISCPNLRSEAFRAEQLDSQMTSQMQDMLSNRMKGLALDKNTSTLTLSRIYQWYAADFQKASGTVIDFILPFVTDLTDRDFLTKHKQEISVKYFDYDWNVNADGALPCSCTAAPSDSCLREGFSCARCLSPCCCPDLTCDQSGPPKCERPSKALRSSNATGAACRADADCAPLDGCEIRCRYSREDDEYRCACASTSSVLV